MTKEIIMKTYPGILTDSKVNGRFKLNVCVHEKSKGFFVIQPADSISTTTSSFLLKEIDLILESKPDVLVFDMKKVSYINSKGLRVILNTYKEMKSRGGRVALINLQPHIREVFDIIDALPTQRIFANRHELDNYLDTMQQRYFDYTYINEFEGGMVNYRLREK
jgi:anti-anti-sigma factor